MADTHPTECTVATCDRTPHGRGLCGRHYQRWQKHGDPLGGKPEKAIDRWWLRVQKEADGGCWNWTAARFDNGYGRFREPLTRRQLLAHRFGYQQLVGEVPEGLELDHLCRNKRCVNPDHLEPVTHEENVRRWQATLVKPSHCRNGHKYTPDTIDWQGSPPVRRCRTCRKANDRKRWGKQAG